jgi:hypothetical protein
MDQEHLSKLLEECLNELNMAYKGKCDADRAERNAALFLEMQIKLADVVSQAELNAKSQKNELERVSSSKYFEYKSGGGDKKITEASLEHSVNKDEEVCRIKSEMIKFEADYKKWQYVINILSNGHIYYRNLSKRDQN